MTRLATVIKRDDNNFDLIRLIAALAVIFGHSFSIFKNGNYYEPVRLLLVSEYSGSLAVYVFFFLSGIFITGSFFSKKNHIQFIVMRVFRIWPALIFCTLITVLVIAPLITTIPIIEYFKARLTWSYLFCDTVIYNIKYLLPGVFENNYYKLAVNGSLWTLPLEITCYTVVFLFGSILTLKNKWLKIGLLIIVAILLYLRFDVVIYAVSNKIYLCFLAGSLCYLLKDYVIIDYKFNIALIILCSILHSNFHYVHLFIFTLLYTVLVINTLPYFIKLKPPGDYSYGVYIYGFLIQQITAQFFPSLNPYNSLLVVVPIVLLIAVLSWHLIEYKCIKLGRTISYQLLKKVK